MNEYTYEIIFNDKLSGLHSICAGIQMGGLIIFLEYGLLNIFSDNNRKITNPVYLGI